MSTDRRNVRFGLGLRWVIRAVASCPWHVHTVYVACQRPRLGYSDTRDGARR
jgi:hypothetical protein